MYAPLVGAAASRAGAVDYNLAVAQRDRTPIEQARGTEAGPDARHSSERGEQQQRRDAGRHEAIEDCLQLGRIRRAHGLDTVRGHGGADTSPAWFQVVLR